MSILNQAKPFAASVIAVIAVMGVSACASNTSGQAQTSTTTPEQSTAASSTDWDAVGQAIGKDGKLMTGDVYRISLPRSDLSVTSQGVQIKPALSLGSYLAFKDMGNGDAMVMGDLVLTEDEYNKVISALQDGGIGQTAVHEHLLDKGQEHGRAGRGSDAHGAATTPSSASAPMTVSRSQLPQGTLPTARRPRGARP